MENSTPRGPLVGWCVMVIMAKALITTGGFGCDKRMENQGTLDLEYYQLCETKDYYHFGRYCSTFGGLF